MKELVRPWLKVVPWETVVSINATLCQARSALHKPTSEGFAPAKQLWEQNRFKDLALTEVLQICFQCHRLAPFCNYNGNTFVAIVKTMLADLLSSLPPDQAHVLRSIAGHIVAGTATDIEVEQLEKILSDLNK